MKKKEKKLKRKMNEKAERERERKHNKRRFHDSHVCDDVHCSLVCNNVGQ